MSASVAKMKAVLEQLDAEGIPPAQAMERVLHQFPNATFEEAKRAVDAVASDMAERVAKAEAELAFFRRIGRYGDGQPKGTTVNESLQAAAAKGDEFAQSVVAWLSSREYRVGQALLAAAADKHPGWARVGNGFRWKAGPKTRRPSSSGSKPITRARLARLKTVSPRKQSGLCGASTPAEAITTLNPLERKNG